VGFRIPLATLVLAGSHVPAALAQNWELGGGAGFAVARSNTVSFRGATGEAGLRRGYLATAYGAHHTYRHLSGELRYTYRPGSPEIAAQGRQAQMAGETHAVQYDFLLHARSKDSGIRPYLAFGGGVKVFRGTGAESAFQPLSEFILLTRTRETLPLLSLGGGASVRLTPHAVFRIDFRDQVTPFPSKVLQPSPGAQLRGWLHDFVPVVSLGWTF
jgi:hypothetical protein